MGRIEEYVKKSFSDIADSPEKEDLMQEIIQNLNEKVADLMELGKSQEDAENKAIVDFGDIDDIKALFETPKQAESYKDKNRRRFASFGFALFGSLIIIALLYSFDIFVVKKILETDFPWYVFPSLGVLFWPLSMLFSWLKHRK
ncbi:MAG TPA: permease prefix domain 1-containing protein [Clostridiales bacterium]|jgi:hypothetical protein|nr:permease prefix domain 1-containing protein [Clostridiales bacterium]HRT82885.1 permease prefix domain 1-containing protein [Oscillospiraceae bacterium]